MRDEDFAECYSARWGRPSIPPSLLAKVLLLAYRDGLSDRRAMEALRFDLRWKVALDLPIDHPGFHPTSLVKFRARLLLHGKERIVFERSLELATELGLLKGSVEQIVDSTPMLGRGRDPGHGDAGPRRGAQAHRRRRRARPARGPRSCARRWRSTTRARGRSRPADWHDKPLAKRCWSRSPPTPSARCAAVEQHPELVAEDDGRRGRAGCCARSSARSSTPPSDDERRRPRPRHGRRSRQIISAHDPEMRHGRKTNARRFTGYKLHVATDAQAPLVTAIAISPGNEHDGHHAAALVEQQPASRRPTAGDRRHRLRQRRSPRATRATRDQGARPAAHHRRRQRRTQSTRTSSRSTSTSRTVTCPQGKTANDLQAPTQRAHAPTATRIARFAPRDCEPCPLRERCAPGGTRNIRINRREDLRQAALRELADPTELAHLKRTRPRIERLLGLIVYRYHARTSRYNGARKTELQAVWTATLVNLHPIGTALRAQTP